MRDTASTRPPRDNELADTHLQAASRGDAKQLPPEAYETLGEIGRDPSGAMVYLARDVNRRGLVALQFRGAIAELNVVPGRPFQIRHELDDILAQEGYVCDSCGHRLATWAYRCPQCNAEIIGLPACEGVSTPWWALLRTVEAAADGAYEVLGVMERAVGGAPVCFARAVGSRRLIALRLLAAPGEPGNYTLRHLALPKSEGASQGDTRAALSEPLLSRWTPLAATPGAGQAGGSPPRPVVLLPIPPSDVFEPPRRAGFPVRALLASAAVALLVSVIALYMATPGLRRVGSGESQPTRFALSPAAPLAQERSAPKPHSPVGEEFGTVLTQDSGSVMIGGTLPEGTHVTIDGRVLDGRTAALAAGTYALRVTAPGYSPVSRRLTVAPGEAVLWSPRLLRADESAPSVPPRNEAAPTPERDAEITAPNLAGFPAAEQQPPAWQRVVVTRRAAPGPQLSCATAFRERQWTIAGTACEREAKAGRVDAQRMLGSLFEQGLGVRQDLTQAMHWVREAAIRGDRPAQYRLGILFASARSDRDDRSAVEWFRRAALKGDRRAQLRLGIAYETGQGTDRNLAEAITWYRRAAEGGHPWAQTHLGWLYASGKGVATNYGKAAEWFRKGAAQGEASAQYYLGWLYANGKGVSRSESQAVALFRRSAKQGESNAIEELRTRELWP